MNEIPNMYIIKNSNLETGSSAKTPVEELGPLVMISQHLPQACSWEEGNDCFPRHIVTYCGCGFRYFLGWET